MARQNHGLEDFLDFASTPEWRSAILSAAVSFAGFHIIVLMTPPLSLGADGVPTQLPGQLAHLGAVLLRLIAPLACFVTALLAYRRRKRVAIRRQR